jgi:hypothetical protein
MFARQLEGQRRYTMAHRWAWIQANGPIPIDYTIDHLCQITSCVNPTHLEAVPHRVNVYRSNGMGGVNHRKTHCDLGHELVWHKNPAEGRYCRVCRRAYDAAYQRRRRAEKGDHINMLRRAAAARKRVMRDAA